VHQRADVVDGPGAREARDDALRLGAVLVRVVAEADAHRVVAVQQRLHLVDQRQRTHTSP
jgi:hypothetical protein